VAYYSKALLVPEKNYCTTRRELLAVVKAVKHVRPYLYRHTFRLRTDHASLIWLCRWANPSSQVARWLEILAEFCIGPNTDPVRNTVMPTGSAAARQMGVSNAKISSVGMVDPLARTLKNSWGKQVHTARRKDNFSPNPLMRLLTTFTQTPSCSGTSRSYVSSKLRYQGW